MCLRKGDAGPTLPQSSKGLLGASILVWGRVKCVACGVPGEVLTLEREQKNRCSQLTGVLPLNHNKQTCFQCFPRTTMDSARFSHVFRSQLEDGFLNSAPGACAAPLAAPRTRARRLAQAEVVETPTAPVGFHCMNSECHS